MKYEMCLVLSSKLSDEERVKELEKVKGYITRFDGQVIEPIEEWGKKRLAYEIKSMNDAYYYFIPFEGKSHTAQEVETFVRIMENVLRYLIVKQ